MNFNEISRKYVERNIENFQDIIMNHKDYRRSISIEEIQEIRVKYLFSKYRDRCMQPNKELWLSLSCSNVNSLTVFDIVQLKEVHGGTDFYIFIGDIVNVAECPLIQQGLIGMGLRESYLFIKLSKFQEIIGELLLAETPSEPVAKLLKTSEILEVKERLPISRYITNSENLEKIIRDWEKEDTYVLEKDGKLAIVKGEFL